jgi:hypothetical protein
MNAQAGGVGISEAGDARDESTLADTTRAFRQYRVPDTRSPLARRDLEFFWSETYATRGAPLDPDNGFTENDLDRYGKTLCDSKSNPFGFLLSDIQLVADYFNFAGGTYNTDPLQNGFLVNQSTYPLLDRSHIDTYLYVPFVSQADPGDAPSLGNRGTAPSDFTSSNEDISTGHPAASAVALTGNSLSLPGPLVTGVGDTGPTAWTRADAPASRVWAHEFQHALNAGVPTGSYTEIFSSAAEALVGETPEAPRNDVPYTWSLLRGSNLGGIHNYAAWRSFGAYLAFNFRGVDTTSQGRSDDLLWRWARTQFHALNELGGQLTNAACPECAQKPYFTGLDANGRVQRLVHNWRVANYVNNSFIADKQFGFPPHLGFDPVVSIGNWRDVDGVQSDNAVALPPELIASSSWRYRPVRLAAHPGGTGFGPRPFGLSMFGAEYLVIHADPAISGTTQDLVVRIVPDSILKGSEVMNGCFTRSSDGLLYASIVGYSADDDSLFVHPELATQVVTK